MEASVGERDGAEMSIRRAEGMSIMQALAMTVAEIPVFLYSTFGQVRCLNSKMLGTFVLKFHSKLLCDYSLQILYTNSLTMVCLNTRF